MIPIRCNNCGKKLAEADIQQGKIEIKCPKCGTLNCMDKKKKEKQRMPLEHQ